MMLDKIYNNSEKFDKIEDNFTFKLFIFIDKCNRVNLFEKIYMQDAFIMFSWKTQIYYYANKNTILTFENFRNQMRLFFEDSEWRRFNLNKWQTISFIQVIATNSTLFASECLQKLCIEVNNIQQEVNSICKTGNGWWNWVWRPRLLVPFSRSRVHLKRLIFLESLSSTIVENKLCRVAFVDERRCKSLYTCCRRRSSIQRFVHLLSSTIVESKICTFAELSSWLYCTTWLRQLLHLNTSSQRTISSFFIFAEETSYHYYRTE
jgi:hypothetical protein